MAPDDPESPAASTPDPGAPGAYAAFLRRAQAGEDEARAAEALDVWFDAAVPAPTGPALDFGAGRGQALAWLHARGWRGLVAYEPDPALARALRDQAGPGASGASSPGSRWEVAPAPGEAPDPLAWLRAREGTLSLVFAKDVLEHVDPDRVVELTAALARALRPGGVLVASAPHAVSFAGTYVRYGDLTHRTAFTAGSLRQLLEAAGLEDVRDHPPRFRPTAHPARLAYRAARRAWHAALRTIYLLEEPAWRLQPPHFFPRLVASARRPVGRA